MPCTYSVVNLREKEREQERKREREEEKKRQIAKKKKALLAALLAMGFEVEAKSADDNKTLITGKKED